ncbi:VirB4-like conjugal transfer ATPase, CD1110 family [uncultured Eubacterium sp.]|uniref:VirB4-like conjugal transfer ATPase, CD1110 family n=1 Tax=uncultured Eubacterium sp. TaxID=165185 RepID=UPI0025F7C733|nr:ATP-binding protein [uncultured Eubacterium sp.]
MKTLKTMIKREKEKFVIPKSVQDVIPIKAVYKDGIFLLSNNNYSKTFKFTDINYHIASDEEKKELMQGYWSVINSFGAGVTIKLTINNHKLDRAEFEKSILIPLRYDGLDNYRQEYNRMLLDKANSSNCIVQDKYFTVTVSKKTVEDARAFFNRIGNDLTARLSRIGSKCDPLTADDKLRIFHNFYRVGNEQNYNLDFEQLMNNGCDIRDYICPDSMDFESDYMKINEEYCRTIFLRNYGTFVDDNTISDLTSINRNLMLSIDFIPIPTGEATKEVDKVLLGIQTDKANYNRKQVQNNNFGATNYDLEQREGEILEIKNDMRNRDQRLYETLITMVITADTKQELDNVTETVFAKVSDSSTNQFATLRYQQLDGLNTVLPFGTRKINCFRTLTTESLAAFMPFNAQEMQHKHGTYYGQNAISNNMIFINRNKLLNGNCIVLGVSGGGKSFFVKEDITSIFLSDENADILIIDPEREYHPLVTTLGGEVIEISANSENHINAMDMNANYEDDKNPIATKAEFIMSLCEQLIGETVDAKDKSIIDRCCCNVYDEYIKSGYKIAPPTLQDFREELLRQNEVEAKELALAIELFTNGSLDTFAQPTNVDTNNRLICYDILELGSQLLPVGMLVVLDNILNRITSNRRKGKTTYIFIDEIYILLAQKYSAEFLYRVWKRVRKYGAFATGITQNVGDMLQSHTASTMVSNSEFVVMLNQSGQDKAKLAKLLDISDNQTEFYTNVDAGHGLMKIGSSLVPYINKFPKNTELYKLMSTKPNEVV